MATGRLMTTFYSTHFLILSCKRWLWTPPSTLPDCLSNQYSLGVVLWLLTGLSSFWPSRYGGRSQALTDYHYQNLEFAQSSSDG